MLLKFTSSDILNTLLVDARSGELAYTVYTVIQTQCTTGRVPTGSPSSQCRSSQASSTSTSLDETPQSNDTVVHPTVRRTWIHACNGQVVAEIGWLNQIPMHFVLMGEKIQNIRNLFGSSTVEFNPKMLIVPTRFDSRYVWQASAHSLQLHNGACVKGQLYHNHILLPYPPHPVKSKPRDPKLTPCDTTTASHLLKSRMPGVGSGFLEFDSELTPAVQPIEIVVSFLMMEIMRRGRFGTRYAFPEPRSRLWKFSHVWNRVVKLTNATK